MLRNEFGESKVCFAILGNSTESLDQQLLRLGTLRLDIHRVPFVDAMHRQEWLDWKERTKEMVGDIGIGTGAAGCALGHRQAWATFQYCDHDYLIVLEDDALITRYGRKNLERTIDYVRNSDLRLIHLGDHVQFNIQSFLSCLIKLNFREILRLFVEHKILFFLKPKFAFNQFPFSGHAYVINRQLAITALTEVNIFLFPIDVFLNSISQVPRNLTARVRTPLIVQSNLRESHIKIRGR